jgi:predicted amidohydrolase YtcJ
MRRITRRSFLAYTAGTAAALGLRVSSAGRMTSESKMADTILTNGRITTLDPARREATALAVKDGLFVAVGSDKDVMTLRGRETRLIDLRGRRVIPGLNDSHLHITRGGRFYNLELRWDGVDSLARGLEIIREQARRTPKAQWVRVIGGWSPYQFKERRMPTLAELNDAAPDTPVFLLFLYSQGFLNRAGIKALGITSETTPPEGGRYELTRDGAILHAEPKPTILYQLIDKLPPLAAEDQVNSTRHFYRELNRFGLTSAIDAGGGGHAFPKDYAATETLAKSADLKMPIRISFYLFAQKAGTELQDYEKWTAEVKLNMNMALARLNAYVAEGAGENLVTSAGDFENFVAARPELPGQMEQELAAVTRLLVKRGWPIRIHATYDESISRMLDVFEQVDKETSGGLTARRWIIDHAETISDRNIERIKRMGGGIAVQDRMAFAGEYFVERYGKEAAATAPPLRKLLDSGIPLGGGTDATRVSSYNPWVSLHWMVSGKTVGGTEIHPNDNRLTREEALRVYTLGSAWFSGEEEIKGRIAPGQLADFAILSADYFSVPEEQIKGIEAVLTVVGGDVVYAGSPFGEVAPPPLPAVSPEWLPVAHFGGYAKK